MESGRPFKKVRVQSQTCREPLGPVLDYIGAVILLEEKMENIIEIKQLNKCFGEVKAVEDLSFQVKKGELFAFLGVNGAGKSTTINIMCGQLSKDRLLL